MQMTQGLLHVAGQELVLMQYTDFALTERLGIHAFMIGAHYVQTGGDLDNVDLMANAGWILATSGLVYYLTGVPETAAILAAVNYGTLRLGKMFFGGPASRDQRV